jgi:hypothetical protein
MDPPKRNQCRQLRPTDSRGYHRKCVPTQGTVRTTQHWSFTRRQSSKLQLMSKCKSCYTCGLRYKSTTSVYRYGSSFHKNTERKPYETACTNTTAPALAERHSYASEHNRNSTLKTLKRIEMGQRATRALHSRHLCIGIDGTTCHND